MPALDHTALDGLLPGEAARRMAVAGPEAIICLHCGRRFRAIRAMHLSRIHGYDDVEPVAAYRRRWGLGAEGTHSQATRDRERAVQEERWEREGCRWPAERVLAEIRLWATKDRRYRSAGRIPLALMEAAGRRFGSWESALGAAGVTRAAILPRYRVTREELLETLRSLHASGQPVSQKAILRSRPDLKAASVREFGPAWSDALRAAGIDPEQVWEPNNPRQFWRSPRQTRAATRSGTVPDAADHFVWYG